MLLADPSEDLVQAYATAGTVVGATVSGDAVGVYVLVDQGTGLMELKNIAVAENMQGRGLGTILLADALERARGRGALRLEVGTGNSSLNQLRFYEAAGFRRDRVDTGFFLRNYPEPIYENGIQCTDMVILSRDFSKDQ